SKHCADLATVRRQAPITSRSNAEADHHTAGDPVNNYPGESLMRSTIARIGASGSSSGKQSAWVRFVTRICVSIFGWRLHRDPRHPLNLAIKIPLVALVAGAATLLAGVAGIVACLVSLPGRRF